MDSFSLAFITILVVIVMMFFWLFNKRWYGVAFVLCIGLIGGVVGYFYPSDEVYFEIFMDHDKGKEITFFDAQEIRMINGIALGMVIGIVAVFTAIKRKIIT
jgi:hypothetical protein